MKMKTDVTEKLLKVSEALRDLAESLMAESTPFSEPEPESIPLEKVRGVLADKSRAGFTAEVRAIIERHGADRLSAIDPKEYPAVLTEAEALT